MTVGNSAPVRRVEERRRRARQRTQQSAKIIAGEAMDDCDIVDQSESGARLSFRNVEPPERFYLLRLKSGELHDVRLVWRDERNAGVAFLASYNLADPASDPKLNRLRQLWVRLNKRSSARI